MSVAQLLRKAAKLTKDGQGDAAKEVYQSILDKFPKNQAARMGLAGLSPKPKSGSPSQAQLQELLALYNAQKMQEAVDMGRALLQQFGDHHLVHNILGAVHLDTGHYLIAMSHFNKVNELAPDYAQGHNNMGAVMNKLRVPEKAVESFERAIAINPKYAQAHSNRNFELNYVAGLSPDVAFEKHMDYEANFGGSANQMVHKSDGVVKRRLRVGYVSPDFYAHSVAYFFEPLLAAHDGDSIETYCYYCAKKMDDTTKRLIGLSDYWRDVADMDDAALAKRIADDRIDILVDLAGHSAKSRVRVFARKPAPVQVAWLGYPNTTGLKAMDYRFTDVIADPVGVADELHSETLVRLDGGIWCYSGGPDAPVPTKSSNDVITFGSFNHTSKLTPKVIALWARILNAVPNSRLMLKHLQLGHAVTRDTVIKQFGIHGIGPDRLDLHAKLPKYADHLALYGKVDVGLDPFPFNGCTTTFEALWMGVPVIALNGDTHVARVGASILTHLGHPELLANDEDDYVGIATELAGDAGRRSQYRAGLRDAVKVSALGDAAGFAAKIEEAYRDMWAKFARNGDTG
jgi:predicted O-linked N-acetylglucosamine transferase (SPINDLY family)